MKEKGTARRAILRSIFTLLWLAGMVLPSPLSSSTQQGNSATPPGSSTSGQKPVASGATPAPANRNATGVKVHGHWTIEVRNPDGTLVTHREFENALVAPTGAVTLSQVLTGADLVGGWEVDLAATTAGNTPPCVFVDPTGAFGGKGPCAIVSPGFQVRGKATFPTLSVAPISGTGGVMLSGTATAGETGNIDTVSSIILYCPLPSPCTNISIAYGPFTSAAVSPAISVTVGQSIAVTVTITFS
jgi:hypothetical protein